MENENKAPTYLAQRDDISILGAMSNPKSREIIFGWWNQQLQEHPVSRLSKIRATTARRISQFWETSKLRRWLGNY